MLKIYKWYCEYNIKNDYTVKILFFKVKNNKNIFSSRPFLFGAKLNIFIFNFIKYKIFCMGVYSVSYSFTLNED